MKWHYSNDWYVWVGRMYEGGRCPLYDGFRMLCMGGEL